VKLQLLFQLFVDLVASEQVRDSVNPVHGILLLSQAEHTRHGFSQLGPLLRLLGQLPAPDCSDGVVAGAPITF
jgi:hypothetical protein